MANFLNNGGLELILGTIAMACYLIWDKIDKKKAKMQHITK